MFSYLSYIASIANGYRALITAFAAITTAIATVALAILTWRYLREIQREREFRLQKEHTENLKRKVVEPWLSEMEEISDAKSGDPPLPRVGYSSVGYKGDKLKVENETLFGDLRNHVDPTIFRTYEKFKEKCKDLSKKYEDFKKKLINVLSTKLRIVSWDEFYQSEELETGFFERDYTLSFFLDSLLSGCKCEVKFVDSLKELHKNSEKLYGLLFNSKYDKPPYAGKYRSEYGQYIDRKIGEKKRAEIKEIIEELLEIYQKEFREEINEIHELIKDVNGSKNKIIGELRKLREKTMFSGDCELISLKK